MQVTFNQCNLYSYPYYALNNEGDRIIVIAPASGWNIDRNELVKGFDESLMTKYTGILSLKFP